MLTGEYKDPDGLIKLWGDYEDTAIELVETGQIEPEATRARLFIALSATRTRA